MDYHEGLNAPRAFSSEDENWMIEFSSVDTGAPRLRGIRKPVYMPFPDGG